MAGHPEKRPIDGKDLLLHSFRPRQPHRAATRRQPGDESNGPSVEFLLLFLRRFVGKPPPASLPSSVRWRLLAARRVGGGAGAGALSCAAAVGAAQPVSPPPLSPMARSADRKSTRLNSSHLGISYA